MTREELEQFIEKHDARADHYYQRYQENGMTIDDRRRKESEDIADLARTVLGIDEIKSERTGLRIMISDWGFRAQQILRTGEGSEQLLKEIARYAADKGLIKPDLYDCDPDKNQECRKTGCFRNGGECSRTFNPEYRRDA